VTVETRGPRAGSDRRQQALAFGAGLTTVVLWSTAFIGVRDAGHQLTGGALSLGRLTVGSLALGAVVLARREPLPARADLPVLVLLGVLWFGVYNVALSEAERRVDAGTAAMLVNTGPILIAVLAGLVLQEGFPRSLLIGCAVAFAGVVIIALATSGAGVTASWGTALCLVAAVAYSVAVVAQKPLLERGSALAVTWIACTVGAVACLPFGPTLVHQASDADGSALIWIVYLGALPTAVAFTTWAYALARSTAGRMGALTYLVPPLTILMGWAFLDETPPTLAFAGGALCLAGAGLTRRR
jgi:drug/metabolite transporter (DMT)-like permease